MVILQCHLFTLIPGVLAVSYSLELCAVVEIGVTSDLPV